MMRLSMETHLTGAALTAPSRLPSQPHAHLAFSHSLCMCLCVCLRLACYHPNDLSDWPRRTTRPRGDTQSFFFGAAEVEMMNAIMHITYGSRRLQRISRQTYTPDLTQAFLYEIEI